jgi:hypothetical protein
VSLVRLSREAIDELVEAAAWYSGRRPGLEMEFLSEAERELSLIESSPGSFPPGVMPVRSTSRCKPITCQET